MNSDFRQEIARRKQDRRLQRSNSWFSMIIRILAFIAIIVVMRYLGQMRAKKIGYLLQSNAPDTTEVFREE